jgi:hypothetical protein
MPQSTSVTLVPIQTLDDLNKDDIIIFRKRLCQVAELSLHNPENLSVRLTVISGEPDDAKTGWRVLSTLTKENAFKLVVG